MPVQEIEQFVERCQKVVTDHNTSNFPTLRPSKLVVQYGKRYAKIVQIDDNGSRSAWAFVEMQTGDIFKPASWAAPAKHSRGNISDNSQGMSQIGPYGPAYLK